MFEAVLRSEQIPRLAGPAAILNGVVVSVFWISLTSIFIYMIFKEDMMVVWGVASRLRPLFLLPPLSFFLTVFACWATISGWKSVQWSVWRKIYFGLLSLSALVCTAVAFHLGLMLLFFK